MQSIKQRDTRALIIVFAGLLYIIAVGYADAMFLSVIQKAFPAGILGQLATVGAIVAGGTAMLLPIALHFWFSPGMQTYTGWAFYIVDFAVMIFNAVLAYQLSQPGKLDPLLVTWRTWCPVTPLIGAVGWGLVFSLDPSNKLRHAQIGLQAVQVGQLAEFMERAAYSPQAQNLVQQAGLMNAWMNAQRLGNQNIPLLYPPAQAPQLTVDGYTATLPPVPQPALSPAPIPMQLAPIPAAQQTQKRGLIAGIKSLFASPAQVSNDADIVTALAQAGYAGQSIHDIIARLQQVDKAAAPAAQPLQGEASTSPLESAPLSSQAGQQSINGSQPTA